MSNVPVCYDLYQTSAHPFDTLVSGMTGVPSSGNLTETAESLGVTNI